jgi:hypothetical protein
MEATIGQKIHKALGLLEDAKAIAPESDELSTKIIEAYAELDSAYCSLMDLSKAINPEPKA